MSHLTERLTPQQSTNLELALSVFPPITDTLKPEQPIAKARRACVRACVDMYISTTSFALLLSPHPPETGLQLKHLTCKLIVS